MRVPLLRMTCEIVQGAPRLNTQIGAVETHMIEWNVKLLQARRHRACVDNRRLMRSTEEAQDRRQQ